MNHLTLYELMQHVHRQMRRDIFQMQEKKGILLSPGQQRVLSFLKEEKGISQKELANKMNIRPASLSEVLTKLEKQGYVLKKRDKSDLRKNGYFLTQQGEKKRKEIKDIRQQMGSEMFHALDETEKVALEHILKKMIEAKEK